MAQFAVIIPAAGQSTRFHSPEKKPFVSLDGRPIWLRSAELFWNRTDVSKVYLVISPDERDSFRTRFGHLMAFANVELVDGGSERYESVSNALARVPAEVSFVAVHDAVRPLVQPKQIDAVFAEAQSHGAAMLAVPVADTLKRVNDTTHTIVETIPRAGLWQAQTPQVFRRDWLVEAYAKRSQFPGNITDDAQLVEALGHTVKVVASTFENFKITTQDDRDLAERLLKSRTQSAAEKPKPRFGDDAEW